MSDDTTPSDPTPEPAEQEHPAPGRPAEGQPRRSQAGQTAPGQGAPTDPPPFPGAQPASPQPFPGGQPNGIGQPVPYPYPVAPAHPETPAYAAGQPQPPVPAGPGYAGPPPQGPGYAGMPPQEPGYAGHAPQGPGAPGSPGGPGAPRRRLGTGGVLAIVGGAVLLVILIGIGAAVAIGSAISASQEAAAERAAAPGRAVTEYLEAVADGDAATALALLSQAPENDALLTDEVLASSNDAAPLTDIEVLSQTGTSGSADVTVSYLLGDTPVTAEYGATDYDDDGTWEVTGGLGYLSLSPFDGLGLTVNGQAAEGTGELELFPGTYQLATSLPSIELTGETTVVVTEPFTSADTSSIEPALTEAATAEFRALVKAAVDACIASTTLAAGCGLDIPATLDDGTQMTDGTIQRSLTADAVTTIDSLEATLSYDNPMLAQGEFIGAIDVTGQCTQGGASGTCSIIFGPSLGRPSIDLAAENPTVLWD